MTDKEQYIKNLKQEIIALITENKNIEFLDLVYKLLLNESR